MAGNIIKKICKASHAITNEINTTLKVINLLTSKHGRFDFQSYSIIDKKHYKAVLSKPGGYWTNDMPFPYVCYNNRSVFPCYGGEQFQKSIYREEDIPLPYGEKGTGKIFFRSNLTYTLNKNELTGKNDDGYHHRKFHFLQDRILIEEVIDLDNNTAEIFYPVNYLFYQIKKIDDYNYDISHYNIPMKLEVTLPCYIHSNSYAAMGRLFSLRHKEILANHTYRKEFAIKILFNPVQ